MTDSTIIFHYERATDGEWSSDINVFIPPRQEGWYYRGPQKVTTQMYNWLRENIPSNDWDCNFDYIRLKNEQDAVMFALRFS